MKALKLGLRLVKKVVIEGIKAVGLTFIIGLAADMITGNKTSFEDIIFA